MVYTLVLIFPSSLQGTMPYLDSSWAYDINYFFHSRFKFGPDLVFTYGPLGFLNNPQHVGHDIAIAVTVHIVFWLALAAQLVSIWISGRRIAATALCISLALGHRLYYDYWDYDLLALSLITIFKLLRTQPNYLDFVLLPLLVGVSFLLKFTAFTVIILMLVVYSAHSLLSRTAFNRRFVIWIGICFVSFPLAYLLYEPSISHMVEYIQGGMQIASGFATSMSSESTVRNHHLAWAACLMLALNLGIGLWQRRLRWTELLLVILVTWVVFRHGFVRGEFGHVTLFFAFAMLIFACLFLGSQRLPLFGSRFKETIPEFILSITYIAFIAVCLNGIAERYPVLTTTNLLPGQAINDLKMLADWKNAVGVVDHGSDELFNALPGMAFRDLIKNRRVMIFPFATPYVARISFEMFPIYALQDYVDYTAFLDNQAARNLIHANPPVDKVLMEWGDIDGRNQMLDTPATSLAFLQSFQLERRVPEAMLLTHRPADLPLSLTSINHQSFVPEQWVNVPVRNQLVAMSIHLKQKPFGALRTALFDQDEVSMDLETKAGSMMHFRVPPETLSNPGLINFVPASLDDLETLWKPEPLTNPVTRIRLTGPGLHWAISSGYDFYEVQNAGVKVQN